MVDLKANDAIEGLVWDIWNEPDMAHTCDRQININEYANVGEQNPAGTAWWISHLERYNAIGLHGNWLSKLSLHDLLANLLTRTSDPHNYNATDYAAAPEFQVYKYYNLNMTGSRVKTSGSSDRLFDIYATVDEGKVRILSGARITPGNWQVTVNKLSTVGFSSQGPVNIQTWSFEGKSVGKRSMLRRTMGRLAQVLG
ncbi:hypothetical protein N7512_004679 [Penicillium capsulatum]|nr:hypothetical protein N7512_004679 [Penicillium capsulatum]